ncbi:unnamed protein product [Paramecium sonneborni]|uniref:Uncharacterized protein n=1 Tax=Paramecium sonneborni TaxID=65129 RepID=A0A8S1NHL5_9CILI|nr:unnamed protein product [Paramecium sonneborni]
MLSEQLTFIFDYLNDLIEKIKDDAALEFFKDLFDKF